MAPGANGTVYIHLEGTAEVAAQLSASIEEATESAGIKDVYLTLTYESNTVEYHPILFTLSKWNATADSGNGAYEAVTGCDGVPLAVLAANINGEDSEFNETYAPNPESELDVSYKLEWEWAFELESNETVTAYTNNSGTLTASSYTFGTDAVNKMDTLLGQLAADSSSAPDEITVSDGTNNWTIEPDTETPNYSTQIAFALNISMVQVRELPDTP